MEYGKIYHECLRLQIVPDGNEEAVIKRAVKFCINYGFDNVILVFNAEEFNDGHPNEEETRKWLGVLKKAKAAFEREGLTVSLNNWMELGHVARGITLKAGQNFSLMTDFTGQTDGLTVCPLGAKWREYFTSYVKKLVEEIEPDTFWIEDDFRLHNHPPLKDIGCFCEEHLQYFGKMLGKSLLRSDFVRQVCAPGKLTPEREAWLNGNGKIMSETAGLIARTVKSAYAAADVGIMSSNPAVHCAEGRRWFEFMESISCGGVKINRIHIPCYRETSGKDFIFEFNSISMAMRALNPPETVILPEIENGDANAYRKSADFFRFELESCLPLIVSGMTYSIFGFSGNGVREDLGYGREVKELHTYMQAFMHLNVKFSCGEGVVVPIDGRAAYCKEFKTDFTDLYPKEYIIAAYLSGLGIAYKYTEEKDICGKTVFLCGDSINYFSDEQLKKLFESNNMIIEGGAALRLKKRKLLYLIGAENAVLRRAESGYQAYEQCEDGQKICNIADMRASCRLAAGDFAEISYTGKAIVHTGVYNRLGTRLADCIAESAGVTVIPFVLDKKLYGAFGELRRFYVVDAVKKGKGFIIAKNEGISPYFYELTQYGVLVFLNAETGDFPSTSFETDFRFERIYALERNGELIAVNFERHGCKVKISRPLKGLSSSVFVLK